MLTKELEERIEKALQQLCHPSLPKGEMGVCIYYFVMGRMAHDACLTQKGEKALQRIMSGMARYKKLSIEKGVTGLGLGVTYLLRHGYVEGDINEVLRDIDSYVYKGIEVIIENEELTDGKLPVLDVLIYFVERYVDTLNPVRKMFYQRMVTRLFNHVYVHRPDTFYQESLPFNLMKDSCLFMSVLVRIHELGIERKRIARIFNEMKIFLFSNVPLSQANRLQLLTVARMVGKCTDDSDWLDYADRLSQGVSLHHVLEEELMDKSILPMSGVIGVWLLVRQNLRMGFRLNPGLTASELRERVLRSSIWNRIEKDGEYLCNCYSLDGYCGVKIFLEYLGKEKANEI